MSHENEADNPVEQHGPVSDRGGRPRQAAAAVPVRPDQRRDVREAPGRRRRDRPGHGQSLRSARGPGDREAGRGRPRSAQPRLQQGDGHSEPAPRGGQQVSRSSTACGSIRRARSIVCLGSKEGFSHMCLALVGPGDTAIVPAPYFPVHVYAVALAAANVIALEVADSEKFLSNIAYTCQHLYPKPKLLIVNYPHNPSTVTVEPRVLRRGGEAGQAVRLHGHQRLCLRRRGVRRLPAAQLPGGAGRDGRGRRVHHDEQGLQHGRLARRLLLRQRRDDPGPGHDQGLLRLRHVPADPDRGDHGPAAHRRGGRGPSGLYQRRRDVLCDGLRRIGWHVTPPRAGMFVWAKIPEPWASR